MTILGVCNPTGVVRLEVDCSASILASRPRRASEGEWRRREGEKEYGARYEAEERYAPWKNTRPRKMRNSSLGWETIKRIEKREREKRKKLFSQERKALGVEQAANNVVVNSCIRGSIVLFGIPDQG